MAEARYDTIGRNYSQYRRTEPSWEAQYREALAGARSVLNVGAGTGSYEQLNREIVALEPSPVMIAQRSTDAAPCVRGIAEQLPFADSSFDATMGVLTMHHWTDVSGGLHELARVAPLHVFTVYEVGETQRFWLLDYFPENRMLEFELQAPNADVVNRVLNVVEERVLWVPKDCREGFTAASWARPHDYLDPNMQDAISFFALCDPAVRERGTAQLRADLDSGAWHDRYGAILDQDQVDFGYRLVIAHSR